VPDSARGDAVLAKTHLTMKAAHSSVVTGTTVRLTGTFTRLDGVPDEEAHSFQLWRSAAGGPWTLRWTRYSPSLTLYDRPTVRSRYEWRFRGGPGLAVATSNIVTVAVTPKVTVGLSKKKVKKHHSVTVSGRVDPRLARASVRIYNGHKRLATVRTNSKGHFSKKLTFGKKGTKHLHVVVRPDSRILGAKSRSVTLHVH
jgi:hypothetical protein